MTRDDIIKRMGWTAAAERGMPDVLDRIERIVRAAEAAEREACARVCEEKKNYSMPIPCPDGISGCLVLHSVPAKREKTGEECAADIRARSKT